VTKLSKARFCRGRIFEFQIVPSAAAACEHGFAVKDAVAVETRNDNPGPTLTFLGGMAPLILLNCVS
jgi:hypothetical protein